jgi:hypothetical protein
LASRVSAFGAGALMTCRVCTANDHHALVEELAAEFWKGA